jgi:hypothetical protein
VLDGRDRIEVLERAESISRARRGRLTPQRREVLTKLLAASRPLTAYEPGLPSGRRPGASVG